MFATPIWIDADLKADVRTLVGRNNRFGVVRNELRQRGRSIGFEIGITVNGFEAVRRVFRGAPALQGIRTGRGHDPFSNRFEQGTPSFRRCQRVSRTACVERTPESVRMTNPYRVRSSWRNRGALRRPAKTMTRSSSKRPGRSFGLSGSHP